LFVFTTILSNSVRIDIVTSVIYYLHL